MTAPRLPDFVVLGQGKAGTSLIYRVLADHPDIGLSNPKELHYFANRFGRGPEWYAKHFAHIPPGVARVGEVSPSYLTAEAVTRVAETLGTDLRVIFVLRRPIERAYSRYLQNICASQKGGGFQGLRFLTKRLRAQHETIRLCYSLFGADNVLPLWYETDVADFAFEAKICDFLGLDRTDHSAPFRAAPRVNSGIMPRYLYAGARDLVLRHDSRAYRIPAQHLVFCGQDRNSAIEPDVPPDVAAQALIRQSAWTAEVGEKDYERMLTRSVLPAAERLEAEFGYDMSHWRIAPRRLAYNPAPPPDSLLEKVRK